jgi:hypothetical protein
MYQKKFDEIQLKFSQLEKDKGVVLSQEILKKDQQKEAVEKNMLAEIAKI